MQRDEPIESGYGTQTSTGRGSGGRSRPPTAVGTDLPGSELLIVNDTWESWAVRDGSILLTQVQSKSEVVVPRPASGTVTLARAAPDGEHLHGRVLRATWGAEIQGLGTEDDEYRILLLARRPAPAALPGSAPVEDLNLLAHTENALKRADVLSVEQVLRTTVTVVLTLRPYPLKTLFDVLEQLHGLRVVDG